MGNSFGRRFIVTTWGESHGASLGVLIDGCPSGVPVVLDDLRAALARDRADDIMATPRSEPNDPEVLSGIFEGVTLGTPIAVMVRNRDVQSEKYRELKDTPRPGHADLTWRARYEHVDWRGGSRASGRECVGRLLGAAVAGKILEAVGIEVYSRVLEMAGESLTAPGGVERARARALEAHASGDSTGGLVEVAARGVPAGLGAPVFFKFDAHLAMALMSIGAVKSVEIGDGIAHAGLLGSESNDPFVPRDGRVVPGSNRCGGILGGITAGSDVVARIAVKPTPSIGKPQQTVNTATGEPASVACRGRFDLNIAPRAAVVAEAMLKLVIADHLIDSGFVHPTRFSLSALLRKEE